MQPAACMYRYKYAIEVRMSYFLPAGRRRVLQASPKYVCRIIHFRRMMLPARVRGRLVEEEHPAKWTNTVRQGHRQDTFLVTNSCGAVVDVSYPLRCCCRCVVCLVQKPASGAVRLLRLVRLLPDSALFLHVSCDACTMRRSGVVRNGLRWSRANCS